MSRRSDTSLCSWRGQTLQELAADWLANNGVGTRHIENLTPVSRTQISDSYWGYARKSFTLVVGWARQFWFEAKIGNVGYTHLLWNRILKRWEPLNPFELFGFRQYDPSEFTDFITFERELITHPRRSGGPRHTSDAMKRFLRFVAIIIPTCIGEMSEWLVDELEAGRFDQRKFVSLQKDLDAVEEMAKAFNDTLKTAEGYDAETARIAAEQTRKRSREEPQTFFLQTHVGYPHETIITNTGLTNANQLFY